MCGGTTGHFATSRPRLGKHPRRRAVESRQTWRTACPSSARSSPAHRPTSTRNSLVSRITLPSPRCRNTGESPGWSSRIRLSVVIVVDGHRRGRQPEPQGRRRVGRDLQDLHLVGDQLGFVVALVDAGPQDDHGVVRQLVAVLGHRLREHHDLDATLQVLEGERGPQLALARVLAGEVGDHAADEHDVAVLAVGQLGDREIGAPLQRPLGAEERVVADVEAEHLLLEGEPLGLVHLEVGDREALVERRLAALGHALAEEAEDARVALAATGQRGVDDLLEDGEQAAALVAEPVERTGLDQRLDGPLVQHRRVDAVGEVVEVGEAPVGVALGDHQGHEPLADVAHRREPERDDARTPRRELRPRRRRVGPEGHEVGGREVDVRVQHLDAHRPALGEVDGGLLQAALHAGEQAGHVLDRVVGLQVRGLVGDQPVAVRVALVEGVVGEGLDDVEELRADVRAVARDVAALDELGPLLRDQDPRLLAAGLPEVVGIGQGVAGERWATRITDSW